ncbi:MAG: exodeoxyribonuclease VII large subunit, partial [Planctomycetota bacterium]
MEISTQKKYLTLSEINSKIKEVIGKEFTETYWIVAEISEIKVSPNGHCFLTLVEKKEDKTLARAEAFIGAHKFQKITEKFNDTQISLQKDIKILFCANINFHERYGLQFHIIDIDPTYTIGEMIQMKRKIIAQLEAEGLMNLNKNLVFPIVPQRIAVISSSTAAGYEDFEKHLNNNLPGYRFYIQLYDTIMQGEEAPQS